MEYGRVRLLVKQTNVERLELLVARWNAETSIDIKILQEELSDARLSEKTTLNALNKAGVKDL